MNIRDLFDREVMGSACTVGYTTVYYGRLWWIMVYFNNILSYILACDGISWYIMVYYGVSWYI